MTGFPKSEEAAAFLFAADGRRKYLSADEARRFLRAAESADPRTRALCRTLGYTGCRISEALALTRPQIDAGTGRLVFRTLKRRKTVFRAVPVPASLIKELTALPGIERHPDRLWGWCRQTAWRRVKAVMARARITGPQATPKGLRHGFGIAAARVNIPPGLTQRWLGHARLETTALYQFAVGAEERAFARRLWR